MSDQAADGGMRRVVPTGAQQSQRVQHFRGVLAAELGGEEVCRLSLESRRRGAFGVEAIVVNAVLKVLDVEPLRDIGGHHPTADQQQAHPRDLYDRHPAEPGGDENRDPREPVAQPPDDGVDERLHRNGPIGGHWQVKELDRGLIDRIPQHLIDAAKDDHRCQRTEHEKADRSEQQGDRNDEKREAQTEPPQQTAGEQPLQGECHQAGIEVELAEECRKGILPFD